MGWDGERGRGREGEREGDGGMGEGEVGRVSEGEYSIICEIGICTKVPIECVVRGFYNIICASKNTIKK